MTTDGSAGRDPDRGVVPAVEESGSFNPRFDRDGLIPCVTTEAGSGDVLMVAWMNAEALERTLATGFVHYWSRSRQALWKKGETSGAVQHVVEMRTDCDQDAIWIIVEQAGAACHTGRTSCFYRAVPLGRAPDGGLRLAFREAERVFDPAAVYGVKADD